MVKPTEEDNPLLKNYIIYGEILPTVKEQLKNYNKIKDEDKEEIKVLQNG